MRYQKNCPGWQAEAENQKGIETQVNRNNSNATANSGQGDFDLIFAALSALDSTRADDRENWWRVGMAVHAGTGGSDAGFFLWDSWSQQSEKYQSSACVQQWRSFKVGKIGVGTLVYMADTDSPGWRQHPNKPKRRWFPKNPNLPKAPLQIQPKKPPRRPITYPTADDAIQAIESRLGQTSQRWEYLDVEWQTCGFILRGDTSSGKTYRPVSRGFDGLWRVTAMPKPCPLYRLPFLRELGEDETIWIVEGEKAADALVSIGLEATTSPGGAQSPAKANWKPLAGLNCVILPDNDEAGLRYADTVQDILYSLHPPATVRILHLPGLGQKQDSFDYIQLQLQKTSTEGAVL